MNKVCGSLISLLFFSACAHRLEVDIPSELRGALNRGKSWTLVEFHHLSDGGTRCYFFTNGFGDAISIWEVNSLDTHKDPYQSYYIRSDGSDNAKMQEVSRGSVLEREILVLLSRAELSLEIQQEGYDGARILMSLKYGIKTRDKTIRSYNRYSREERRSLGMSVEEYDREVIWYRKRRQEREISRIESSD